MASVRSLLDTLGPLGSVLVEGPDVELAEVALVGAQEPLPRGRATVVVAAGRPDLSQAQHIGVLLLPSRYVDDEVRALPVPVIGVRDDVPLNHLVHLVGSALSAGLVVTSATGDLFALANTVAVMVGGATAIEDPQRRVLAYSTVPGQRIDDARSAGILGRQVPDYDRNDGDYQRLVRGRDVLHTPLDGDLLPRLAVAVRSGAEVLGFLWVIEAVDMPADAAERLLEAADLVAVHLVRARAGRGVERRARGEVLRRLLDGSTPPELAAARLAVEAGQPVAVVAVSLPADVAEHETDAEAIADLVLALCGAVRERSAVLLELSTAYALVPATGLSRQQLGQLGSSIVTRARQSLGVTLTVGIGSTVEGLHEVTRSRADADAVLRVAPEGSVSALEDVLALVALKDLHAEVARNPHLRLPAVEALLAHDAQQGTPYAETVLAYLAAQHDVVAASASISIHQNTFRYRLRRARELFGLDLDDPDVRLLTWLRLRTGP